MMVNRTVIVEQGGTSFNVTLTPNTTGVTAFSNQGGRRRNLGSWDWLAEQTVQEMTDADIANSVEERARFIGICVGMLEQKGETLAGRVKASTLRELCAKHKIRWRLP